ncbi:MAG: CCE_0567 family metalloprotein [Leptolyngbyaceae cyanobacterium bins.59]|nr:CCE_0567 family metalloprotein [Leptolyngbyaceae cyanobacterium bins.59]
MVQSTETPLSQDAEELKVQIKRLNSKAGQMKMDLHDLAEGLPTDYDRLVQAATETYEVYQKLDALRKQLAKVEKGT